MHDQSSGLTMIMGGVDRPAGLRREARTARRLTVAFLALIAVLMVTAGWRAGSVSTQLVVAAAPATGSAPHHAHLRPADLSAPPAVESYMYPY